MSARRRLADRRQSLALAVVHEGWAYTAHVSFFDDGGVAEVFLEAGKAGTPVQAAARDLGVCASLALQFGCPLEVLEKALTKRETGPAGPLGAVIAEVRAALEDLGRGDTSRHPGAGRGPVAAPQSSAGSDLDSGLRRNDEGGKGGA